MSWTEQNIQVLRDLWGNGYSASEIAKRLGGMTRNAVIGKAHRLKLSGRPSPIRDQQDGAFAGERARTMPGIKSMPRKRSMLRPLPSVPMPATVKVPSVPPRDRDVFKSLESINKKIEGISVTKAGERHCRWPVGDPRSPDFRFCGCNAHEGLPYCVDHARVAYQNISRRTRNSGMGAGMDVRMQSTTAH
jgi:GcrA cell cycle regulator